VGYEFSLIGKDQSVGDPNRLRVPLDEGTMVIAAHACSYGLMLHEKFLPTLRELAGRYRGFYADVSALTLPNRFRMLLHLRKHPALHPRLLFGTDYPLPVFRFPAWGRGGSAHAEPLRPPGDGVPGARGGVRLARRHLAASGRLGYGNSRSAFL
jgi:hypothetical protein